MADKESFREASITRQQQQQEESHISVSADSLTSAASIAAFRRPDPKPETVATKALHLLDARRIRRDALKRNFDLEPDDGTTPQAAATATATPDGTKPAAAAGSPSAQQQKRGGGGGRSPSPTSTADSNSDFALFGRSIPSGVFRDQVRRYLITGFETLSLPVPPSSADKDDDLEKKKDQRKRPAGSVNRFKATAAAVAVTAKAEKDVYGTAGAKRVFRRAEHDQRTTELRLHRKLLDTARGELSADVASMLTGSSFRKLVRSTTNAEEKERDLLEARAKLPFSVGEKSYFAVGAFPDRPPSPRTLRLQARRSRVAQLLSDTADYSQFLSMNTASVLFWMHRYMLHRAQLAPANTFFGMPADVSEKERDLQRSCAVIIAPQHLEQNLARRLPNSVLDEKDVAFLMRQMAPRYQEAVEKNREAAERGGTPSLLVRLAKAKKAAGTPLEPDMHELLQRHEAATRHVEVPTEPISLEAALLRLNRAVQEAQENGGGGNTQRHTPLALLCYIAFFPRGLRSSAAVLNSSASAPPPALTREMLSATASEYEALGGDANEKMASLVRSFMSGFHLHFQHVSLGIDVDLLCDEKMTAGLHRVPTQFSPALADLTGESDCPICTISGKNSHYSYVDYKVLASLREEAKMHLVDIYEAQVLHALSKAGTPKSPHEIESERRAMNPTAAAAASHFGVNSNNNNNRHSTESSDDEDDHDSDDDDDDDCESHGTAAAAPIHGAEAKEGDGKERYRLLKNTEWRCEIAQFHNDLKDFAVETGKRKKRSRKKNSPPAAAAAAAALKQSAGVDVRQLNDRYFDCFVTHLVMCPQFAAMMSSLVLKCIIQQTR